MVCMFVCMCVSGGLLWYSLINKLNTILANNNNNNHNNNNNNNNNIYQTTRNVIDIKACKIKCFIIILNNNLNMLKIFRTYANQTKK